MPGYKEYIDRSLYDDLIDLNVTVDNQACIPYQIGYWFHIIDASICGAKTDADTQLNVFDSPASEKQLLIFQEFQRNALRKSYQKG